MQVTNDSAAHAGHSAMRATGGGNGETHFSVLVVSTLFINLVSLSPSVSLSFLADSLRSRFGSLGRNQKDKGKEY